MTKRILFALVVVAAVALLAPTMAFANYAIHGNYLTDTDACAGCHRAHTSVSTIEWTDTLGTQHNALLTTSATRMIDFCYACHDATSQGADTNVQQGIYEGSLYDNPATPAIEGQNSSLNGGGFETFEGQPVTSMHDSVGGQWGAYGGGYWGDGDLNADGQDPNANTGETAPIVMDCATCHDPHGSSNYRILKASVFGNTVGGYDPNGPGATVDNPTPDGWVQSTEVGWPIGGFELHTAYPNYKPDYITARYAKGYDMTTNAVNENKGMTGWCSGCHATYNNKATDYATGGGFASDYNAGDGFGLATRHRHPVNVELSAYKGADAASMIVTDQVLPLAHDLDLSESGNTGGNTASDWIECLTCHRAHGTSAVMTGWASNEGAANVGQPFVSPGINSEHPSALLRLNNRGVCEVCHNK